MGGLLYACTAPELLRVPDIHQLPSSAPDARLTYGPVDSLQFGELRLPEDEGPHPVIVLIHGGCWLSAYDLHLMDAMATDLVEAGYATWNIEYRRVGDEGGGWPGTFQDVAAAVDYLREIAPDYALDLDRVIAMGHSAGGHLALWLGARDQLPENSALYTSDPLPLTGIISLAGITDPESYLVREPGSCGSAVDELLGGLPEAVNSRYVLASPLHQAPLGVSQVLVSGEKDPIVPLDHVKTYFTAAQNAGDPIRLVTGKKAGHFELIAPGSRIWRKVEKAVVTLMGE